MLNRYGPSAQTLFRDFYDHFDGLEKKVVEWCEHMRTEGVLRRKQRDGYVEYILTKAGMNRCTPHVQEQIMKFRLPPQAELDAELAVHWIRSHGLSDRFDLYDLVRIAMEHGDYDELPTAQYNQKEEELSKRYERVIVYLLKHGDIHEYSKEPGVYILLVEEDDEDDTDFEDFFFEED